jgi:DNA-binding response OmpR family regulator
MICPCCKQPLPKVEGVAVSLDDNVAIVGGRPIQLTPKQAEILKVLIDRAPATATREHIVYRVWGLNEREATAKNLDVQMHNLRQRICREGIRIQTIWGRGWRLVLTGKRAA